MGATDRGGAPAWQDTAEGTAADDFGDILATPEWAKWRSIPTELGPWWLAAQLFIRWSRQGVWDRLLELVQQRGVVLGMTFIDGTNVRAHHKAAGAKKGGPTARGGICARRLAALAAATEPRPA